MAIEENNLQVYLPINWAADWVLDKKLGAGSYATVWRAVRRDHPAVDAAIKIMSIPGNQSEAAALMAEGLDPVQAQKYYNDIARRYVKEIDLLERFKGTPNIVNIEDYRVQRKPNEIGNDIFIRMELLTPLDNVLRHKILSEKEIIEIGIDICSALELCEEMNIIHRDIKPANIFINDKLRSHTYYKLGDFGIARSMENLTHGLSAKGTPSYMAPEVFAGKKYDNRADIYSLGITLYRMMNNNRLPLVPEGNFSAAAREDALSRRLGGERLPPPCRGRKETNRIILKACAFNSAHRYATASQMKKDLEAALREESAAEGLPSTEKDRATENASPVGRTASVSKPVFHTEPNKTAKPIQAVRTERDAVSSQPRFQAAGKDKKKTALWAILAASILVLGILVWVIISSAGTGKTNKPVTETPRLSATTQNMTEGEVQGVELTPMPTLVETEAPTPTLAPTETPDPGHVKGQAPGPEQSAEPSPAPTPTSAAVNPNDPYQVGSCVSFGTYPQTTAGTDLTPIEWLILDRDGDKVLLISKYGLDAKQYDPDSDRATYWENCSIRTWLNNEFMQKAFSREEQKIILTTDVDNSWSQGYNNWYTDGGNNTKDQVFLLSYAEANRYFNVTYSNSQNTVSRIEPTAYAIKNGAYISSSYKTADGAAAGWWWLRSPGGEQNRAARVDHFGMPNYSWVSNSDVCVRPAMWVKIDSNLLQLVSEAPESTPMPSVEPSSEPTYEPTPEPTSTPTSIPPTEPSASWGVSGAKQEFDTFRDFSKWPTEQYILTSSTVRKISLKTDDGKEISLNSRRYAIPSSNWTMMWLLPEGTVLEVGKAYTVTYQDTFGLKTEGLPPVEVFKPRKE